MTISKGWLALFALLSAVFGVLLFFALFYFVLTSDGGFLSDDSSNVWFGIASLVLLTLYVYVLRKMVKRIGRRAWLYVAVTIVFFVGTPVGLRLFS